MFEESVSSIWASMSSWLTPTVLFLLLNLVIGTIAIASSLGTQKHHDQDQDHHHHHHQQGLQRSPSVLQRFKTINLYNYRSPEPATNYEKAPESETHFAFPHTHEVQQPQQLLPRSPSMLERLQSFKFQFHFPKESSPQQTRNFVLPDPEPEAHYTTYDHHSQDEDEETEHHSHEDEVEELDEDQFEGEQKEQTLDEIYRQLQLHEHVSRTTSDTKPASGEVPPKLPNKMKKSASAKSAFAHFSAEDIVESRRPATVREKKTKADHEDDEEVDAKADDFINRFKQQLKLQRIDSIIRYKDMITRGSDT